jgi:hypothetical protein
MSLMTLVSLLALALPSVNAFATTGCYPAGALTAILSGLLTITTTGITTPQACSVSTFPKSMCPNVSDRRRTGPLR